jgi:predicted dehydrogenase
MSERISPTVVIGAGICFKSNFENSLDILGSDTQRVILDSNHAALTKVKSGLTIQADARFLPLKNQQDTTAVVAIPHHLPAITELVARGCRRLIVEKPLVNNTSELTALEELLKQHPDIKLFSLDYYQQKFYPFDILTGKIGVSDPRFQYVTNTGNGSISKSLIGSLFDRVGEIRGIDLELIEGGELGVPDLDRRPWLEYDPVAGGVLLDLGTHAFGPLFYSGLVSEISVISASRKILAPDRKSFLCGTGGKPEILAKAKLVAKTAQGQVNINFKVGKVPYEGRRSEFRIYGDKAQLVMELQRGGSLKIKSGREKTLEMKLKAGIDPYQLALKEADGFFKGEISCDEYYQAMRKAIVLIDQIKAVS